MEREELETCRERELADLRRERVRDLWRGRELANLRREFETCGERVRDLWREKS